MRKFTFKLSPASIRDLDHLPKQQAKKILKDLYVLEENPFPRGKLIKKIQGKKSAFYCLRVGQYRVFYSIEGSEVIVLKIVARKDAEKFIKNL